MTWTRHHLIDVADLALDELDLILERAGQMRLRIEEGAGGDESGGPGLHGHELRGQHVALLFAEPSTRTRLSFETAARRLSGETYVLDPGSSSLVKGESLADTARNLDAIGFTMLVLRHHRSGAAAVAARHFGGSVLNGGDGWTAHPTQALLDLFTLRRALSVSGPVGGSGGVGLAGRKVVIIGDVRHSRVARSNVWSLTAAGADLWLSGPRPWLEGMDRLAAALPAGRRLTITDDARAAIDGADAVMALRVQRERMRSGALSLDDYIARYQVNSRTLALARPGAYFLHPGPINEGIEVSREVAIGPRSLVLEQARNGVPIRMAVLALLAEAQGQGNPNAQRSSATRDFSSARR